MPDSLKDVLDTTVKMVNFVKARPLNSCVFSTLCNDKGSDHVRLLQHSEVRCLSRGKVLTCFFKLRDELKAFFTDHNFHLSDRLHEHDDERQIQIKLQKIFIFYEITSAIHQNTA